MQEPSIDRPNPSPLTEEEFHAAKALARLQLDERILNPAQEENDPLTQSLLGKLLVVLSMSPNPEHAMKLLSMNDPLQFAAHVRQEVIGQNEATQNPEPFDESELEGFTTALNERILRVRDIYRMNPNPSILTHLRATHALASVRSISEALHSGLLVTEKPFTLPAFGLMARSVVAGFNETCQ